MRELDDATLELQLRRVLDERLGALSLELTAEALERHRVDRDRARRRRRIGLVLGLAAALALPVGWLVTGAMVPRPPAPSVVVEAPTPSPRSSELPSLSPSELSGVTPPSVEELGRWTTARLSAFGSALLADGRVLLVGGADTTAGQRTVAAAWLFDPATRRIEPTGAMTTARAHPLAVTLSDGRVLVFGGWAEEPSSGAQSTVSSAELYDPSTGMFTPTAGLPDERRDCACGALNILPWAIQHATLLLDGRVLVAGGDLLRDANGATVADVFDPTTERWSRLAVGCDAARGTQALLPDGRLLITCVEGGRESPATLRARLFDPETDGFSEAATPPFADSVATPLADGRILLSGREPVVYDPVADAYERLPTGPRPGPAQGGFDVGHGRALFLGEPDGSPTLTFDTRSGIFAVGPASLATADAVVALGDGRILTVGYQLEARLLRPGQAP